MTEREPMQPSKVQPTYAGFVILRLNQIWGVWAEGNYEQALRLSLRFADALTPRKIKERLQDDVKVIRKKLNEAYSLSANNFFGTQLRRNREARKVAFRYCGPFISKLSDLLDEAGYYEKTLTRLQSSDFAKLGEKE